MFISNNLVWIKDRFKPECLSLLVENAGKGFFVYQVASEIRKFLKPELQPAGKNVILYV